MNLITKKPWWWFITGRQWGDVAMTWGKNVYIAEDKIRGEILAHEMCHVRQHKGSNWVALYHFIRANLSNDYYNKMEEEATQAQLAYRKYIETHKK